MPYKDPQIRKKKAREYTKSYISRLSAQEKDQRKKKQREHKRDVLSGMSAAQKEEFYKKMHQRSYKKDAWRYAEAHRRLRKSAIEKLGGRCANLMCRWLNHDGSIGCTDFRCLQIDHVNGDGVKDRKAVGVTSTFLRKVLKDTDGMYQLLCSNCNWIKRVENKEYMKAIHLKEAA